MRYGIFSDIHSNLEAFSAAIEAYKNERIERYLCIGDIVGYAANPSECIDKVRELKAVIVAGNHDWGACGRLDLEYFNPTAKEALKWTMGFLSKAESDFLSSLPLAYSEENFILAHGTLDSPEEFYYLDSMDEADRTFSILDKQVCFVGHTHRPGVFIERDNELFYKGLSSLQVEDNKRYIINVGSVGQPRDGDFRASFVIYDTAAKNVELKRIDYDFTAAQKKILRAGLPEFLARRLSEGR